MKSDITSSGEHALRNSKLFRHLENWLLIEFLKFFNLPDIMLVRRVSRRIAHKIEDVGESLEYFKTAPHLK